jgi:hypothetical protein
MEIFTLEVLQDVSKSVRALTYDVCVHKAIEFDIQRTMRRDIFL